MKAILATRCGCQQVMNVRSPPPPKLLLPLHPPGQWGVYSFNPEAPSNPPDPVDPLHTRTFILTEQTRSPLDDAYYAEE